MHSAKRISGPIIMKKAEHFAVLHGFTDFKPNSGWLDRWKKRFQLSFLNMCGESEKVDDAAVESWFGYKQPFWTSE